MKILDKEVEFDFFDAEEMEKYEKEADIAKEKINTIILSTKTMKQSEIINKTCEIVESCFDNVFGVESSKEIFGGKRNFRLCLKAFKDLLKARKEQENELDTELTDFEKELKEINADYKPNRVTRRTKK